MRQVAETVDRGLSIVIPSKLVTNLISCLRAIQSHDPGHRVIVIDDGLNLAALEWEQRLPRIRILSGVSPFVFARNVNLGIRAAGDDDVILLNDDAMLQTPDGFTAMQQAAQPDGPGRVNQFGIISATTNVAGNPAQHPQGVGLREEPRTVAFVCVLIPRRTIEAIGLLDEAFVAYGWEDNDYCRRVRRAGGKIGIFDGCFVDHESLQSTFRGHARAAGSIADGATIYKSKWGDLL